MTHVVSAAAVQVFSRIWALWGIIELVPDSTTKGGITLLKTDSVKVELSLISLLLAWSISEVLRYTFYVFKVSRPPDSPYVVDGSCPLRSSAAQCSVSTGGARLYHSFDMDPALADQISSAWNSDEPADDLASAARLPVAVRRSAWTPPALPHGA